MSQLPESLRLSNIQNRFRQLDARNILKFYFDVDGGLKAKVPDWSNLPEIASSL